MTNERVKDILFGALDLDADERARYLDQQCADDDAMRRRVEELIAAHEHATGFLDDAQDQSRHPTLAPTDSPSSSLIGSSVGRYKIVSELGEGGFGAVFLARQESPVKRSVAIKIIKPGMDTQQVIRRFEQERQALAVMDHPAIARVFDAGTAENGRPYFVMEHVEGPPITSFCDRRRLTITERLHLFERVCLAVQHAHQKGVIHRDLKPSNVLVTEVDGRPEPKVIDFGIAKAVGDQIGDHTAMTQARQILGTPQYMSPEQAALDGTRVDTRSDVYSLGVLLYELLSGVTPFDAQRLCKLPFGELERIITHEDPPRPSTRISSLSDGADEIAVARRLDAHRLWRQVKGDLDWIVMRALEKDPARRYPTAYALASDIRRFLNDEPVEAGPPSATYKVSKFVRRHRLEIGAAITVGVALAVLAIGGVWFALRERAAGARLEEQLIRSRALADFSRGMLAGIDPAEARDADTTLLRRILDDASARVGSELADHPASAVEMLSTIGFAYETIGEYENAERTLRQAMLLGTGSLPEDANETTEAKANLGAVLIATNRFDEAVALFTEVADVRRARLGDEHPETLSAQTNLAVAMKDSGRLHDSRHLLETTLEARRRVLGPSHEDTMGTMNNLAVVLGQLDEKDEERELLEQVLDFQIARNGETHPHTLATMNNLAGSYLGDGRNEQAERMLRRVLEVKRTILEPDHPSMLITQANLADLLVKTDRTDEAELIYRAALATSRRTVGDRHMYTAGLLNGLARCMTTTQRHEQAEPLLAESTMIITELAGETHPHAITLSSNLAVVRQRLGRHEEALAGAQRAHTLASQTLGPTHRTTVGARKTVARSLASLGRFDDAEPVMLELHSECAQSLGDDHKLTVGVRELIVEIYIDWDKPGEAAKWTREPTTD